MKASLITNGFLNTSKYTELNRWLIEAGERRKIQIELKSNDKCLARVGGIGKEYPDKMSGERPDFVLFWDKDIRLAQYLEYQGYRLFNSAHAIEACDNKAMTHLILEQAHIPMPRTIIGPKTYAGPGYNQIEFLTGIISELGLPLIIKECFGSFGQQVYFIATPQECIKKVKELEGKDILFQEFIQTSFARDVRLQVVGDQVIAAMYRYSETGDFRANISGGGKMKPYLPTVEQTELAINSCKALGLDYAGVDLLFAEGDRPLVCEVNSNAHFKNIYDCTGVNAADHIMEHILQKIKETG